MKLLFLPFAVSLLASARANASDDETKQLVTQRELMSSEEFYIVNKDAHDQVVDVSGGCGSGNNIHLGTRNGTPSQLFKFGPNDSIINIGCNQVLDVAEGNCDDATNIQLYDPTGTGAQQWRLLKSSMAIENIQCNKVLDISNGDTTVGTNIWLSGVNGTSAQKWTIEYSQKQVLGRTTQTTRSSWEGPLTAPLVGAAAAALPDGRVLLWSSHAKYSFGSAGQTWTAIFDPSTKRFSEELVSTPGHNMFCPGIAGLGDGRIMVSGGSSSDRTTFYDPASNMWAAGPRMNIPRGYHSMVTLGNGSVLTIGGSWSGGRGNKDGEVYQSYRWHRKPGIKADVLLTDAKSDYFMWLFQAPDGRCFHPGPSKMMHWIDTEGQGSIQEAGLRGGDDDAMNGNAVMYDIGKILVVGGSKDFGRGGLGSVHTHVIDINSHNAVVKRVGNMGWRRTFANSIVLPTGDVVVIGGKSRAAAFSDADSVYTAEIWSPKTGQWTRLSKMKVPRVYHSTAVLTKDGRIVAAGGGLCGSCKANHPDVEIFTPPYLLNSNGTPAHRPTIRNAPDRVVSGDEIRVNLGANVPGASFALIRASTVTHSTNQDQRRIPLRINRNDRNGWFTLQVPDNENVVIPGNYYLFAMDKTGTPSVASSLIVQTFIAGLGDGGTWRHVNGWASDIGAGGYGVAVIGGGERIYKLDSSGNRWNNIPGGASQIAVGDHTMFVANRHGTAYKYGSERWHAYAGIKVKDIGSSGNKVCVIRSDSRILCKTGSGGFHLLSGNAERIDVCPNGRPVVVNVHGIAYYYTGSNWRGMPGKYTDIACGPDGVIWATGRGEGVHRWLGSIWEKIPGEGVRISVDKNGIPWTVTGFGEIFQYEPHGMGGAFGRAFDIGAGAYGVAVIGSGEKIWKLASSGNSWNQVAGGAGEIAVGDHTMFVVNRHGAAYVFGNGRWNGYSNIKVKDIGSSGNKVCVIRSDSAILCKTGSGAFQVIPGGAERIDVCPNGRPVVVNAHGTAYYYTGSRWNVLPGKHMDIACGPGNNIWTIGSDEGLNRWSGSSWEQLPGRGRRISVDNHGTAWIVTTYGRVFEYEYEPYEMNDAFGRALDIGADAYGVAVIGSGDSIWRRAGNSWNKVAGGATEIAVGDHTMFVVNRHGAAYEYGNGRWNGYSNIKVKDIGSSGNKVCVTRSDSRILCKTGTGGFQLLSGFADRVDVCPNGRPVVVNVHGNAYYYTGSEWQGMPGKHMDIACGPGNKVWSIDNHEGLNRWSGSSWEQLPGGGRRLSVDNHGRPWVVSTSGKVYQYKV